MASAEHRAARNTHRRPSTLRSKPCPRQRPQLPLRSGPPKKTPASDEGKAAATLIDARIQELKDWRGELLARLRAVILSAGASVVEEWKWNTPVWSSGGIICTGESYKKAVKLTFAKGASLPDPSGLFNSSLEGKVRRAIDFTEGASVDEPALRALVQAAIGQTGDKAARKPKRAA